MSPSMRSFATWFSNLTWSNAAAIAFAFAILCVLVTLVVDDWVEKRPKNMAKRTAAARDAAMFRWGMRR